MDVKVSIIIPVYNAEKYIPECMESLLNQTLKECEFIFINDGSNDGSEQIIRQYLEKDSRIVLFNQENQGVSNARNKGLEAASGEYIGFVDADDFVKEDMYEILYKTAKQGGYDAVVSDFQSGMGNQFSRHRYPFAMDVPHNKDYINETVLPYLMEYEDMNTACNKVYNRKRITDYSIRFPDQMAIGEDGIFNLLFFSKASSFYYMNYSGYFYRTVFGSATRSLVCADDASKLMEIYRRKELDEIERIIGSEKMIELKSRKLVRSIFAYFYQMVAATENSLLQRIKNIQTVINNEFVRESIKYYSPSGRYEQTILKMLKVRFTMGILLAVVYSHKRNENKG